MRFTKKIGIYLLFTLLIILIVSNFAYANISGTVHNLSTSGPGTVKSDTEDKICIFCHTPHNSNPSMAIWNHTTSGQPYTIYDSTISKTMDATDTGQPAGTSKLCLSCHDGTVAIGGTLEGTISMTGTATDDTMPATSADMGTDLSDDHPQDFTYDSNLATQDTLLKDPDSTNSGLGGTVTEDMLQNSKMRCTSCHKPHDNTNGNFLIMDNSNHELCTTCHSQLSGTTSHKDCIWCHTQHDAAEPSQIRKFGDEENLCFHCHDGQAHTVDGKDINGGAAITDIQAQVTKLTAHKVQNHTGEHDPVQVEGSPPKNKPKHVECSDCHNQHASNGVPHTQGTNQASGILAGLEGLAADYSSAIAVGYPTLSVVNPIDYEYELCLRCHSSANSTGNGGWWSTTLDPSSSSYNPSAYMDKYINPKNKEHHAFVEAGNTTNTAMNNTFTPNSGIDINSTIYCSDCHGNDNPSGPEGPHGSDTDFNVRKSEYTDSEGNSYVCYDCHWVEVYGPGGNYNYYSRFPEHQKTNHTKTHSSIAYPSNIPNYACFLCHGDFYRGGLHGTNQGN